jgi:hypothetical protein
MTAGKNGNFNDRFWRKRSFMTAFWSLFRSEKAHFLHEVAHFSLKVAHFRQNRWHLVAAHSPKQVAHWGKGNTCTGGYRYRSTKCNGDDDYRKERWERERVTSWKSCDSTGIRDHWRYLMPTSWWYIDKASSSDKSEETNRVV